MDVLFIVRVFGRNLLRGSRQRNICSYLVLLEMFHMAFEEFFTSNKTILVCYLLNNGDVLFITGTNYKNMTISP